MFPAVPALIPPEPPVPIRLNVPVTWSEPLPLMSSAPFDPVSAATIVSVRFAALELAL